MYLYVFVCVHAYARKGQFRSVALHFDCLHCSSSGSPLLSTGGSFKLCCLPQGGCELGVLLPCSVPCHLLRGPFLCSISSVLYIYSFCGLSTGALEFLPIGSCVLCAPSQAHWILPCPRPGIILLKQFLVPFVRQWHRGAMVWALGCSLPLEMFSKDLKVTCADSNMKLPVGALSF